jgi:hypothetical protein
VQYKGYWNEEKTEIIGIGEIKFEDGSVYQGETYDKIFHGKGRMSHANGDIFQGHYNMGKANGYGVLQDSEGAMYAGEWKDDI